MSGSIVIFIISSARSGSTLLGKFLDSHTKTNLVNEITRQRGLTTELSKKAENHQTVNEDIARIFKPYKMGWYKYALHRSRLLKFSLMTLVKVINHSLSFLGYQGWSYWRKVWYINSLHEPLVKPLWTVSFTKINPDTWIFKEIIPRDAIDWLTNNPEISCKIIHLIRSPYTRTASELRDDSRKSIHQDLLFYAKMGLKVDPHYASKSMAYQTAYDWVNQNDFLLKDGLKNYPHMHVRYEDLVNDPRITLDKYLIS
jgi:hypothetical protein